MEPQAITLGDFKQIVRRRIWSLILPMILFSATGVALALALPPVYKSTSLILIEEQEIPADFVMTTVTSYAEQRIQAIKQRVMGFTRLMEIIQKFGLYPEIRGKKPDEEIVEKMREDIALDAVVEKIIDRRTGAKKEANIAFTLSYQGSHPAVVQQITNVLTSLYLEENLKVRVKQVEQTAEFLEGEIAKLKRDLEDTEKALAVFKQRHQNELPSMLPMNQQMVFESERKIETLAEQMRSLKDREAYIKEQLAVVKPLLANEEQRDQRRKFEDLRLQLDQAVGRYSDQHPDVIRLRNDLAELEKKVKVSDPAAGSREADNPAFITLRAQLASTQIEADSLRRQIIDLQANAQEFRRRIAATPAIEEEYNDLMIRKTNTLAKYNDLMRKLMEAKVATGLEKEQKGERFTLIEPPRLPNKPFKPNRLAIMLIGIVLGVGAGVGFAALREFSDGSVHTADQLESATRFPVLGGIPMIETAKDRRQRRLRYALVSVSAVGMVAAGVLVLHFFVMDLDVFWAKLARRIPL
jgi:polysaccharide chain length determinant protein (PEP-CTERM system associated)